jgi:hypothetical protein
MRNVGRKLAFVLAASNHGTMITNRFDYRMSGVAGLTAAVQPGSFSCGSATEMPVTGAV